MKLRVTILSLVFGAIACLIAQQSVYTSVDRLRFKLLPRPSPPNTDGTAAIRYINPRPKDATILVMRIKNNSDENHTFMIRQNGNGIASFTAEKQKTVRYMIQIPEEAKCTNCRLTIIGKNPKWQLQTVEIRNVYGFSSVWLKAVLTERSFQNYSKLNILQLALIFLITFLIAAQLFSANFSKTLLIPAVVVVFLFAGVLAIPLFSERKILLSTTAFIKLWIISFLPFWIITWQRIRVRPKLKPYIVAVIVALTFVGGMLMKLDEYEGNFSGFIHVSKKFLGRNEILFERPEVRRELLKEDTTGYDGQFFYFIAFDPLVRHYEITSNPNTRPIDDPAFRYRRIAYPVLTKLVSANNPLHYPAAMVFLAISGVALCGFFLSKTAIMNGLHGWEGLVCLLIPSFWFALSVATPEPLAAAFLAAGFYLTMKKKYGIAAIFFSLAILTRESSALFVLILAAFEFKSSTARKSTLILASSFIPYLAWRTYVTIALFHVDGWRTFFVEPETTGLPFSGIIQMYRMIYAGTYTEAIELQALRLPILLVIVLGVCLYVYVRTKNTAGLIGAIYAFLALSLSYKKVWIDIANVERLSYESFLCLGLLHATRPQTSKINIAIYFALAMTLIYDLLIMVRSDMFRAGLLWLLKC
jgi:hypothetical protein